MRHLLITALLLAGCSGIEQPKIPAGYEADDTGACYPADITFDHIEGNLYMVKSASAGASRMIIRYQIEDPAAANPFSENSCATFINAKPTGIIITGIGRDKYLKHEGGHALGLTTHNCAPKTFRGCDE